MRWNDLIGEVAALSRSASKNPEITGIEYDSRHVQPGSIFIAMRGGSTDGNRFIESAISLGASAILTDSPQAFQDLAAHPEIPSVLAAHGRTALAQASAAFYGHPERQLHSTAVTGTNGKTTTAFLIESLLNAAHRKTILVGTIENHIAGEIRPSSHTTPESRDLFELMTEGARHGATELVMEASSHALDQGRVAGIGFDTAVFTNLTRDHLDYHGTMEAYFAAKRLLFDGARYPAPRVAILNVDDRQGDELQRIADRAGSETYTYGLSASADWIAEEISLAPSGAEFTLIAPAVTARIQSPLAGEVNILNLLAALAAAHARGVAIDQLLDAIPKLRPVPGRFQAVDAGQPFTVIVDYAHTDDALRNLTALARQLLSSQPTPGHVLTLFGCGGDRDRTKRPKMGKAAGEGSDFVVLTSDNPRSEAPMAIIEEILPGVASTNTPCSIEPDRAQAIQLALAKVQPGDIVLIAGKGHEKQQVLRDVILPFDDAEVALSALRALGYGGKQ